MNLNASAPDESFSRGSSLVRIRNRVGSRPVHGFGYFRSDGERVLPRNREQPLSENSLIRTQPRVRHNRQRLTDQLLQSEVGRQARDRRSCEYRRARLGR